MSSWSALNSALHQRALSLLLPVLETSAALSRSTPMNRADYTLRSEEHTSELQSLMRISYAVFCLIKKLAHHNPYIMNCSQHACNPVPSTHSFYQLLTTTTHIYYQ